MKKEKSNGKKTRSGLVSSNLINFFDNKNLIKEKNKIIRDFLKKKSENEKCEFFDIVDNFLEGTIGGHIFFDITIINGYYEIMKYVRTIFIELFSPYDFLRHNGLKIEEYKHFSESYNDYEDAFMLVTIRNNLIHDFEIKEDLLKKVNNKSFKQENGKEKELERFKKEIEEKFEDKPISDIFLGALDHIIFLIKIIRFTEEQKGRNEVKRL